MPKNLKDWSVGVEEFDVLALLRAKALCPAAEIKLDAQLKKLKYLRFKKIARPT